MRRFATLFSAFFITVGGTSAAFSQWQNGLAKRPEGAKYTLSEVSQAFDAYWAPFRVDGGFYTENGKRVKASGWKPFKRIEYYWEQRVNPATGEFPTTSAVQEFERSRFRLNKSAGVTSTASWTNIGTNSSTGGYAGIGRINCVAFHPTDVNTYWVGSPSGGIWKTSNNGGTWSILNNDMSILGVSDIAVPGDYVTSNTLYIATGDRDAGSLWSLGTGDAADNPSIGVYKSTNGGATWSATGLTFATTTKILMGRLLIASNNSTLFAGTSYGVHRSTDAGASWSLVYNIGRYIVDMEFKPGDEQTIYASTKSSSNPKIFRSTDGGTTWSLVFTGVAGSDARIELAVTPADPTYVYAIVTYYNGSAYALRSILKSTDSGANFSVVYDGTLANHNLLGYNADASGTAGQGTYDLTIAASPDDRDIVFIGGVNTWFSTNGGTSWTIKTMWYPNGVQQAVHADKHCLAFQNGSTLFEGNDGGVYRAALTNGSWSDPGSNYVDKSNGLVISQLYRIGVSKTDPTKTLTGLQDNGSKLYNSAVWSDVTGGDGMECIIDHANPLYMYTTYTNGLIYKSTNGFSNQVYTTISNAIPGGNVGAWVTPYIMDPTNSAVLYVGYDKIWKTSDRGASWTALSAALSPSTKLRSLAIAPSNTNIMYTADLANVWKSTDAATATPPAAWTSITGTLPVGSGSVTYLAVKADDPQTVWATLGGFTAGDKVFQTTDGGTTWTNISGTLPNVPVLCIVQNTRAASTQLFIGTDAGVYAKDGNDDWILFNDGMPIVVVTELEFYYGAAQADDRLRAATFGRGLWETPVSAVLPVELTRFTAVPRDHRVKLDWTTATERNNAGFEIQRSAGNADWTNVAFTAGAGTSNAPTMYSYFDSPSGGTVFTYRLKQVDTDGRFKYSDAVEVALNNPSAFVVHQNFPNPFNPSTTIRYDLPIAGMVTVKLYDSYGRELRTLLTRQESAGYHEFVFDGSQYASGVYYYSIQSGEHMRTTRMVLLK